MAFTAWTIMASLLATVSANDEVEKEFNRLQAIRFTKKPSSAIYSIAGDSHPSFLGRQATCRCYTAENGDYYVEEKADTWSTKCWFISGKVVWCYTDDTGQYVYLVNVEAKDTNEEFLIKGGFPISCMHHFDFQCVQLSKRFSLEKTEDRRFEGTSRGSKIAIKIAHDSFNIDIDGEIRKKISYNTEMGTPKWIGEAVDFLNDVVSKKIESVVVNGDFSFDRIFQDIAGKNEMDEEVSIENLGDVSRVRGYLILIGRNITLLSAKTSGRGRFLSLAISIDGVRHECLQYKMTTKWAADGRLLSSPIPVHTIVKRKRCGVGELLLMSNGKQVMPSTCFIHPTGQTISFSGDLYDSRSFCEALAALPR